jgi:2-oxoisovalerate dehydrogenase E1 component
MRRTDWLDVARDVLRSREIDRHEIEELTPRKKVLLQFSAGGHELTQVLLARELRHPHDGATVYYRCRPFLLASGLTVREALVASMARAGSPSEGRDTGALLSLPRRTGATVLPPSGDVGAQYAPAAGWAEAVRYRRDVLREADWEGAIAVALGGDGSVAASGFWAALNVVTTSRLPMLLVIENNGYGISVPAHRQTPGGDIGANLAAYGGLRTVSAVAHEPAECADRIRESVNHVRRGEGPCLLHLRVPRLLGHAYNDRQHYRGAEELEEATARDPLDALLRYLRELGTTEEEIAALREEVRREVAEASAAAEAGSRPEDATRHRFFEGAAPVVGGIRSEGAVVPATTVVPSPSGPRLSLMDAIRRTLEHELEVNPRAVIFGQDVGVLGGVHRVTQGLHRRFGDDRVFDTSLSEEGILGRAHGMALAGLTPVPEIQFRKYADAAHEQLSDIGTLRWRTAGRFAAPMALRLPVGFSRRAGDPYHAVNGEAIYAHLPGWRIAFPSHAGDAVGLLREALRGDDPTILLEHRYLLDAEEARRPYPGDAYALPFGRAATVVEGDALTVISWGAMLHRCVEAGEALAGRVTVIDLRTISPWDEETVLESVRATGRALIVHEDTRTAGFGAEIAATIASEAILDLEAPVRRLAPPDCPTPYEPGLMDAVVPTVARIREAMRELLTF